MAYEFMQKQRVKCYFWGAFCSSNEGIIGMLIISMICFVITRVHKFICQQPLVSQFNTICYYVCVVVVFIYLQI